MVVAWHVAVCSFSTKIQKYLRQFITSSFVHFGIFCCHLTNLPPLYCLLHAPPNRPHLFALYTHRYLPTDRLLVSVGLFWGSLCFISISQTLYLFQLAISQLHLEHSFSVIQRGTYTQTRRRIKRMRQSRIK